MDLAAILVLLYAGALLLFILTLLCGQNEICRKTPLPRLHYFVTEGLCATVEAVAHRCCGHRGTRLLKSTGELCCERSNPVIQVLFLILLGGCYWAAWHYVFPMLPLPGIPAWHKYTGTAGALACLSLFLVASFSDPGTVTPANVAAHRALYPCDEMLYEEKECWTCKLPRPARSKHCATCGRCVAKLDHHCIWLNSCVGLLNMRWFLVFLLTTAALCFYAAVLCVRLMRCDMAQNDTFNTVFIHPQTEQLVYLTDSWRYMLHYITTVYGPQARKVALTFFTGVVGWIVAGFLAYQLYLIGAGLTTAEVHRRQVLTLARELEDEARQVEERVERQLAGGDRPGRSSSSGSGGAGSSGAAALATDGAVQNGGTPPGLPAQQQLQGRQSQQQQQQRRPPLPNHYDRGVWRNFSEVLFPHHHLRLAAARSAPDGGVALEKASKSA